MWQCPTCQRWFKSLNQGHTCSTRDLWDLFEGKSDELLLTFDLLMETVLAWQPCTVGPAKRAVVFTSTKAWLIVRPMKDKLDLKFYQGRELDSPALHAIKLERSRYAHHIRVSSRDDLTPELFALLERGHAYIAES